MGFPTQNGDKVGHSDDEKIRTQGSGAGNRRVGSEARTSAKAQGRADW